MEEKKVPLDSADEKKPIEMTFYDLSFHYKYFMENPDVEWVLIDPRIDNSLKKTGWGDRTRRVEEILEQKTLRNLRYNKSIVIGSSYPFDTYEEDSDDEEEKEKEEEVKMEVKEEEKEDFPPSAGKKRPVHGQGDGEDGERDDAPVAKRLCPKEK